MNAADKMILGRTDRDRAVDLFSEAMTRELVANETKGDWTETSVDAMCQSLCYHVAKLLVASKVGNLAAVHEYAADVGNEAMFVCDLHGALVHKPSGKPMLIRDVMFAPSAGGDPAAWAEHESDEASEVSSDLMDLAKRFVRSVMTIDPNRATPPGKAY